MPYEAASRTLCEPPSGRGWSFGDCAFGLEPLTLPNPADLGLDEQARAGEYRGACGRLREIGMREAAPGEIELGDGASALFWFRWITGHQASFVLWRMMARLVTQVQQGRHGAAEATDPLALYITGYTAMLLYTGSCPRATYDGLIRPSMRLQHPGFSGSWAPDYWPVRKLLRGRLTDFTQPPRSQELRQAISLHHAVHGGVAARLVPDGRSLLQQSDAQLRDMRILHLLYDNFFLTLRSPVSHDQVIAQLLRRLTAIAQDVAVHGMHPVACDDLPAELRRPEVTLCESRFGLILSDIAEQATAVARDRV